MHCKKNVVHIGGLRMKKHQHSTTIYLPRKDNSFLVRAIRARSQQVYTKDGALGKNSKYIVSLIKQDLESVGFLENGEPVIKELEKAEANLITNSKIMD